MNITTQMKETYWVKARDEKYAFLAQNVYHDTSGVRFERLKKGGKALQCFIPFSNLVYIMEAENETTTTE